MSSTSATSARARCQVLEDADLLKTVFRNLGIEDLCLAALVCRKWYIITSSDDFWSVLDLHERDIPAERATTLLLRRPQVQVLNARKVEFSHEDFQLVLPKLSKLRDLELEKHVWSDGEISRVLSLAPQLTRLAISACLSDFVQQPGAANDTNNGDNSAENLIMQHENLQKLSLEDGSLGRLSGDFPTLEELELRNLRIFGSSLRVAKLKAPRLEVLKIEDGKRISEQGIVQLFDLQSPVSCLANLRSLHLYRMALTDSSLLLMSQKLTRLTSLHLQMVVSLTMEFEDNVSVASIELFPSLLEMSLGSSEGITGDNAGRFFSALPQLIELSINNCGSLDNFSLDSRSLQHLALQNLRNLKELVVNCPELVVFEMAPWTLGLSPARRLNSMHLVCYALPSLSLCQFPQLSQLYLDCLMLAELELQNCPKLADTMFERLQTSVTNRPRQGCPSLRSMSMERCDGMRNIHLVSATMRTLRIYHSQNVQKITVDCPLIIELAVEQCEDLREVTLLSGSVCALALGTCPRLHQLNVRSQSMTVLDLKGCNDLSSLDVHCPMLKRFDGTFCCHLTDDALVSVTRSSDVLEDVSLAACVDITDAGLTQLSRLERLTSLDVSYTFVHDPAEIVSHAKHLRKLSLSNCGLILKAQIQKLLQPPHYLTSLSILEEFDISYNSALTSSLLVDILLQMPRLRKFIANGCCGVGDDLWRLLHRRDADTETNTGSLSLQQLSLGSIAGFHHVSLGFDNTLKPVPTLVANLKELKLNILPVGRVDICLPNLTHLCLDQCPQLKEFHLDVPELKHLSLNACCLTLPVIAGVINQCPSLEEMCLRHGAMCVDDVLALEDQFSELVVKW